MPHSIFETSAPYDIVYEKQLVTLAVFLVAQRPTLLGSLPTLAATSGAASEIASAQDLQLRLRHAVDMINDPKMLTEIMKFGLRHLKTSQGPLISSSAYKNFVKSEHSASYPPDAYVTILLATLPGSVTNLLDVIFNLLSASVAAAPDARLSAGRQCSQFGLWVLGSSKASHRDATLFYQNWSACGRQLEHVYYAWIRWVCT